MGTKFRPQLYQTCRVPVAERLYDGADSVRLLRFGRLGALAIENPCQKRQTDKRPISEPYLRQSEQISFRYEEYGRGFGYPDTALPTRPT